MVVNHHLRAVGQITSVDGVFIGGLYYYLIALVYKFSAGNPASAVWLVTALGGITVFSFYWVGKRLYGVKTGILAGFIYAIAAGAVFFDRWSVPTQPTVLWSIWFLYVFMALARGWKKEWWLYGILVGLIWHIHIALLPLIPLPALAYIISGKKNKWDKKTARSIGFGLLLVIILISPGILFELKTGFSQTKAMIVASKIAVAGVPTGMQKLNKVFEASGIEVRKMLWLFDDLISGKVIWVGVLILISCTFWLQKRRREVVWILIWMMVILMVQFWSKRPVSEYYFVNLIPAIVILFALVLEKIRNLGILVFIFCLYFGLNLNAYVKNLDNNEALIYRLKTVEYIKQQAVDRKYPCISINYIAKFGEGVGFRYLFWWSGIKVIKSDPKVANFDIVIPGSISGNELNAQFGRFGIINSKARAENLDAKLCEEISKQLDPLLGYVD